MRFLKNDCIYESRVVHMLQKELTSSANPCTTLGCYEALLRLSQVYPPVHLPRGWGCNIPRIRKMSTGVLSGPGLNRSFPNPGFEIVVSAVKCLSVSSLALELVRNYCHILIPNHSKSRLL